MERLTIKTPKGAALNMDDEYPNEAAIRADLMRRYRIAIDRLAAYEDTGLMPAEIPERIVMLPPVCYKEDGDECAYQTYDGTDEPIDACKECPLCCVDKQRHQSPANSPLTLEELREMDGQPVYIRRINDSHIESGWALVHREWCGCKTASGCVAFFERYGEFWLAYRSRERLAQTGGGNDMKCCEICRWYEDYEGVCTCADSEHCADYVVADAVCEAWEEVWP